MKKLQLKKEVVARLDDDQMNQMRGGAQMSQTNICPTDNCPSLPPHCVELQSKEPDASCSCLILIKDPTDTCAPAYSNCPCM